MSAFSTAEDLREEILRRYDTLSKRLKQVAEFAIDHEHEMAVETLATIADRCGVQPSAIVRFAKSFGFEGASAMQRLFRDKLLRQQVSRDYRERVRRAGETRDDARPTPASLLGDFAAAGAASLDRLAAECDPDALADAVDRIAGARHVYVAAFQRSYPVASYLHYALRKAGVHVVSVDGVGGLHREQIEGCGDADLLFAIGFNPYADEIERVCEVARGSGAPVLAITDSELSPLFAAADIAFLVHDAEVMGFRTLTATLSLAQSLVVALVHREHGSAAPQGAAVAGERTRS